ncbi:rod shape-determining protein MreD [Lactobacillus jensenii]|uniref:rod shape-determining protein MreD n=1 Tax=Lactobacillus jensenii TaxID=109790 RepID=UPI0022436D2D|nr:rod shape-determining protein MreD [Lactobacillus jensenii]MCW8088722.1 rod shape-determining protein MreD [Lactobacillus jensenii]
MNSRSKFSRWYIAVAEFIALIFDGVISIYAHSLLVLSGISASFWLIVIAVAACSLIDENNNNEIILAFFMGLIADIYYLGFIGPYTVGLTFVSWLCQKVTRILPDVFVVRVPVIVICYLLFDVFFWFILTIASTISIPFSQVIWGMIANAILALILASVTYPIFNFLGREYPFAIRMNYYK